MRIGVVGAVLALSLGAAVADAAPPNTTVCLKPWAIPDKWIDNHDETAPIDQIWTPDDTFETVDAQDNPLPDADVYIAPTATDPGTGFTLPGDLGVPLTLKVGDTELSFVPAVNGQPAAQLSCSSEDHLTKHLLPFPLNSFTSPSTPNTSSTPNRLRIEP